MQRARWYHYLTPLIIIILTGMKGKWSVKTFISCPYLPFSLCYIVLKSVDFVIVPGSQLWTIKFFYRLEDTFAFHRWKYLHLALDDIIFCSLPLLAEYIINYFIALLQDNKAIANSLTCLFIKEMSGATTKTTKDRLCRLIIISSLVE